MAEEKAPVQEFDLRRIYIKDLSFESPSAPGVFTKEWKPTINLDLNNKSTQVGDDQYEVLLAITITATNGEGSEPAFIVEVQQGGLFYAKGFDDIALQQLLGAYCPSVLFPYAREAVSDVVSKGGFPQLLLTPLNFDRLYAQAKERQNAAVDAKANNDEGPAGRHLS